VHGWMVVPSTGVARIVRHCFVWLQLHDHSLPPELLCELTSMPPSLGIGVERYPWSLPMAATRMLGLLHTALAMQTPYEIMRASRVLHPATGALASPLDGLDSKRALVVLVPQLGEFDSCEYCEQLSAVTAELADADVAVRVVGIGDAHAGRRFCDFMGFPVENLRCDRDGTLHRALGLHSGPQWSVPEGVPDEALNLLLRTLPGGAPDDPSQLRPVADAWLRYLAMCAGIGAPGTLREILRGYIGDTAAPERLAEGAVVKAGFVTIGPGVGPVQVGPLAYSQWWADERGYQRPVELATVRLRHMVEVLSHWSEYVSEPTAIAQRGGTYLFAADGSIEYEYAHRGVLTYTETPSRPLSFLSEYIGETRARNPLGLPDEAAGGRRGGAKARGALKPAGKAMGLLAPLFSLQARAQASLLGVGEAELDQAKGAVDKVLKEHGAVLYTYGLSPFSAEAVALLDAAGAAYERVELGPEWFLLGKEASALRLALLERTGQSSLPHVFVGGEHVGGLFSGSPGLAALSESGELVPRLQASGAIGTR
jgi:glutaredoxin